VWCLPPAPVRLPGGQRRWLHLWQVPPLRLVGSIAAAVALLRALQCDAGTGHHMRKPLPVAECCDWVARWQARGPAAPGPVAALRAGAPLLHGALW
jgi:hypothetical protein